MNYDLELTESLRYLLLPISSEHEENCRNVVKEILNNGGIGEDSHPAFIKIKYEEWKSGEGLAPGLSSIIEGVLLTSNPQNGALFAEKYFEIHESLLANPLLSFQTVSLVLSHLRLITSLAMAERMSSAKIALTLNSIDVRLSNVSWKDIQVVLNKLRFQPKVESTDSERQYSLDEELEEVSFADSDLLGAAEQVAIVAANLEFPNNIFDLLSILSDPEKVHTPYLQILHYQCLISEFYDHVLTVPYEFNPRGTVANWLFAKWNDLVHTSNPILNNAKAVNVLDENWARSRKKNEFEPAFALVSLLKGLDGMGFSSSQELAAWLRRWLVRYIKLNSQEIEIIDIDKSADTIFELLTQIVAAPTQTYGILEQRFVDLCTSSLYKLGDGWRPRGLHDSVNANNTSKRKLGDCDFQNSSTKEIRAYEAHGGHLSRVYFDGHIRTLRRSFERRSEELQGVADLSDWEITIVFVAYSFEDDLDFEVVINGVTMSIEFLTMDQLFILVDPTSDEFSESFEEFLTIINDRRTPKKVRERLKEFL